MRRALVVLLLLLMPSPGSAQSEPIQMEVVHIGFTYGPEDWKGGDPRRIVDESSLRRESTPWQASLGLSLAMQVRINMSDMDGLDFEATISDGATSVPGIASMQNGILSMRFDVDGQRAVLDQAERLPLQPGTWTLRVRAEEPDPLGPVPRGTGSVQFTTGGIADLGLWMPASLRPVAGVSIPEDLLPGVTEVGPGSATWLPSEPIRPGARIVATVKASPGANVTFVAYEPIVVANEATTRWETRITGSAVAGRDGIVQATLGLGNDTGLRILAAYTDGGGVTTWALGITGDAPRIDSLTAPRPGTEGSVALGIATPRDVQAGSAYALHQGAARAARVLSQAPLLPDGEGHMRADLDARNMRRDGSPAYTILALTQDESGYTGHTAMQRGIELAMAQPRLGVGVESELRFEIRNLASDGEAGVAPLAAFTADVTARFQGATAARTIEVPEAGSIAHTWKVTPKEAGASEWTVLVDSGDIRYEARHVATVLTAEDYEAAERAWYDPENVTPVPWYLALLALAAGLRRKR